MGVVDLDERKSRDKEEECENQRQLLHVSEKANDRKQMVRRTSGEDEETNHAGLPMEEWRMKAQRVFW